VRARVDGKVYNWMRLPKIDAKRKHSVEGVVDRSKCARSFAAPGGIVRNRAAFVDGTARVVRMDGAQLAKNQDEWVFSKPLGCSVCGYSLAELEPRLFSFNNPSGACPSCDGLGVQGILRSRAWCITRNCRRPAARCGLGSAQCVLFQLIQVLAKSSSSDVEAPYKSLSANG